MNSKQEALKKLRVWKMIYFMTFCLPIGVVVSHAVYSITFTPEVQDLLISQAGAIYQNEDLTQTSVSEGTLKQLVYETLQSTFTYNYLSFVSDEDYTKLLNGTLSSDLPDHRDKIRPLFRTEAYLAVIDELKQSEWMRKMYAQSRRVEVYMSTPPTRDSIVSDWVTSNDGRLNAKYNGYLYVVSFSNKYKTQRYRLDYQVTLERKVNLPELNMPSYFFSPMVEINTNEWWVKSLDWSVERKQ